MEGLSASREMCNQFNDEALFVIELKKIVTDESRECDKTLCSSMTFLVTMSNFVINREGLRIVTTDL